MLIVTFGCSRNIHVYPDKCGVLPMDPYKMHNSIEVAEKYLVSKGIKNPKVITQGRKLNQKVIA